jgi:hypothetical protein
MMEASARLRSVFSYVRPVLHRERIARMYSEAAPYNLQLGMGLT